MALDFLQVRKQVLKLGESAPQREQRLQSLRDQARHLLHSHANDVDGLRQRVERIVGHHDPSLYCAIPVNEPLDAHHNPVMACEEATLIAADGSQINFDRHAEVAYCLVNVGAIQMRWGSPAAPTAKVETRLLFGDELYTPMGTITNAMVDLMRDLNERCILADLAADAEPPVITFTDGPMELWAERVREGGDVSEFQRRLEEYKQALSRLCAMSVTTAGYVDKPAAPLVVRLLELASLAESEIVGTAREHPLRGVTDHDLYAYLLAPGERSAVFRIQFKSAADYRDELALHFFYLNVGRRQHPWLARVEVPAWVAASQEQLDRLHAALIDQCRIMGARPYPYLLHRAHETALVTRQERDQVTQMIARELRSRGVPVGELSHKQSSKELAGRMRYSG